MTTLSLLDLIERPAILGLDRKPASVPGARPVPASPSTPPRQRERVRGARADRSGGCTPQDLFELFERERRDRRDRDRSSPAPQPGSVQRVVGGDGPTLDDLLTGTWDALTAGHTAACPVCAGPMQPRYAAGPIPVGGRCGRCATELS